MISILLTSFFSAASATTGGVVLFRGSPGAAGDVQIVDPSGATPPRVPAGLAGITLLPPLDFNGRVEIASLLPTSPRYRDDVPGASRIELPHELGSLYAFSRPSPGPSARVFGVLLIDSSGEARSVFEWPGIGAALDQLSFNERIAVAPSGDRITLTTKFGAGGDLFEIDLATGATLNRTSSLAPQRFLPAGLHLTASWGIAGTETGVLRFDRANSLNANAVAFANGPAWFAGQIVTSANGQHAATSAGAGAGSAHVFVFSLSGAARQVTTQPAQISAAGFLPEHDHGPYMAVSDDAAWCAWRTETPTSREAFVAPVPAAVPTNNAQITADANYTDTLDEIGWFSFRGATHKLVLAIGSLSTPGPPVIENLDFYEITPSSTTSPTIFNLTQTNGITQPPFTEESELKPSRLYALPSTNWLLMHSEQSGGGGELTLANTAQSGTTVLLANVKELGLVEPAGGRIVIDLRRSNGPKNRELYTLAAPYTSLSPMLLSVPGATTFERPAARADGWFAFVQTTLNKERLWRHDPLANTVEILNNRALYYGPSLAWAPSGELAFSVGAGGFSSIFAAWPTSAPVLRLPVGVGPGFVLPGS